MTAQAMPPLPVLWDDYARDWARSLRARNLSHNTSRIYLGALNQLAARVAGQRGEIPVSDVGRADLEDWAENRHTQVSAATVSNEYRALQQFFKWLCDEEEIPNPFDKMTAPLVPEQPVAVLTDAQLTALLDTCDSRSFVDRRDTAIIRLLMDTGGRLAELAELKFPDDVDQDAQVLHVMGKGRRGRALPYNAKAADALSRYLRTRKAELAKKTRRRARPASDETWLWLAVNNRGRLEANGIKIMLRRRGELAGIKGLHAHQFRHTMSHDWLANGGNEIDLMRLNGWKSPAMLRRYGASMADERAREAHKKLARGDRI